MIRKSFFLQLVALLLLPISVAAQNQALSREKADSFDPIAIATYRWQLDELARLYLELAINPATQRMATDFAIRGEQLSDEDIAIFMASGADLSDLLQAVGELQQLVADTEETAALGGDAVWVKSAGFPDADYTLFCGSERPGLLIFAARSALDLAKVVWSFADRTCNQVAVAAGFGGNVSTVCIIADGVLFVAEALLDAFADCKENINTKEIEGSYDRLGHLHVDLETIQADVSSDMRLRIEENLMESAPTFVIVSYQLPGAFGGHLELVSTVVEDAITNTLAAGQSVNSAELFFDQAEVLAAAAEYKGAYLMYRRAYREVGRLP